MKDTNYRLSYIEIIRFCIGYVLFFLLLGKLFYDSFQSGFLSLFLLPLFLKQKEKELGKKKQQELVLQFRDFILSFRNSLKAGYSIENGFVQAYHDLCFVYEQNARIIKECEEIVKQMKNNIPLEALLLDFANRSGCPDIIDFAHIFATAKKTGGDLNKIIQNSAQIISDKIEVKEEISLVLASKRMEQRIMNFVPILILVYIRFSSEGYFDVLYGNLAGIMIMTICLFIYCAAYLLSKKIIAIEV